MSAKTIYTDEHGPVVSMDDFDILERENQSLRSELQNLKGEYQKLYGNYDKHDGRINSLLAELQKQKELNAELVEYLKLARTDMVKLGMDPGHNHVHKISSAIKRVESLIKKSQSA